MKMKTSVGAVGLILVMGLIVLMASAGGAQAPASTEALTGWDLVNALELRTLTPETVDSCAGDVVEIEEDVAVCVDVTSDDIEQWRIAQQIQGHIPTEQEMTAFARIHELQAKLDDASARGATQEAQAIQEELEELVLSLR